MAQLYNPPSKWLLRSLLLQCVIMLGLAASVVAQATTPVPTSTVTYHGPWSTPSQPGLTTSGLSIDGADLEPSGTGGSAQLRNANTSYVDIQLPVVEAGNRSTPYKVSYSLSASTTRPSSFNAQVTVRYSTSGINGSYDDFKTIAVTRQVTRDSIALPSNATNVRFVLTNISEAYVFLDAIEVTQDPAISGFAPEQGVAGDNITITGERLNEVTAVRFGETEAKIFTSEGGTQIIVTVPSGVQSANITVVSPYGQAVSAMKFVVPDPIVEGFTPAGGAGDVITVTGKYFTDAKGVQFNGVPADISTISVAEDGNSLKVAVPAGASDGPITVLGVARSGSSKANFDVLAPAITGFTPENGGEVGTLVTIFGDYLAAVTGVQFNGVDARDFKLNAEGNIEVTVPLGAATGLIRVLSPAGPGVSPRDFEVPAPQVIARTIEGTSYEFRPTTAGPDMVVTIYGANLSGVSRVIFLGDSENPGDDKEAEIVASASDKELSVRVPAGAASGLIRLIAPGEGKTATTTTEFTYVPAPVIASVTNTSFEDGRTYGIVGDKVTITGENFRTLTGVRFGGVTLEKDAYTLTGETTITFTIPSEAATGTAVVTTQGGTATWDGPFDVIKSPAFTSMVPEKGPIGRDIIITGEYFKYVSSVTFVGAEGRIPAVFTVPAGSNTQVTVTVPEGARSGALVITNPAGTVETGVYEVIVTPVIQAFNPEAGIEGDVVTITGYNFTGATAITIGASNVIGPFDADTNPGGFNVKSDTELTVRIPADATTGLITVTNANGPGSSGKPFTIMQAPSIKAITPLKGIAGNTVTITGEWFVGEGMVVTFLGTNGEKDDTDATVNVTPQNITEEGSVIKVAVPKGAVTGPLMVTNAAGNSAPSAQTYTIVSTPEIISFNKDEGKVDDKVVISGWLLDQVDGVRFFNGINAAFTYDAEGGTITATVPGGASTGPLSLVVDETVVFTTKDVFTVIPVPTISAISPNKGMEGTAVVVTGTNFEGLSRVTFLGAEGTDEAVNATLPTEVTPTSFTVIVPTGAKTGLIEIVAQGGTAVSPEPFTIAVPEDISFEPNTSYANQVITIKGRYMTGATAVTVNKEPATILSNTDEVNSETNELTGYQIITVAAPFDAGTGTIAVTTAAGTGESKAEYTVIEPIIDNISMRQAYVNQDEITITGRYFRSYWADGALADGPPVVKFGRNGTEVTVASATETSITVLVPVGAQSGFVTVRSGSGISKEEPFALKSPTNITVTPDIAYAGQRIKVTGDNFIDLRSVTYNGESVAILNPVENSVGGSFEFIAPAAKPSPNNGTAALIVTTLSGSGSASFTIRKPIINSFSPARIYAGFDPTDVRSELTLNGENFQRVWSGTAIGNGTPRVRFTGSSSDAPLVFHRDNFIIVNVPADAETGPVTVTTENGVGVSQTDVVIIGTPRIDSFTPIGGIERSIVKITGDFFDDALSVTFLGDEADPTDDKTVTSANFISRSNTSITVNVPAGAKTGKIAVTNLHVKQPTGVSEDVFRVIYTPVITGFTPKFGPHGASVEITGENLWDATGNLQVFFDRHSGVDFPTSTPELLEAAVTSSDITEKGKRVVVTVPNGAITGAITLKNAAGTRTTVQDLGTPNGIFEVTSPLIVRIEDENGSENNASNPARLLETVFIKGYSLKDVGSVAVNGVNAPNFWERDQNTLEVEVPTGATTGRVTVTTLNGTVTSTKDLVIVGPTIRAIPNLLTFKTQVGTAMEVKYYDVSASNLAVGESLTIAMTGDLVFQIQRAESSEALSENGWGRGLTVPADANGTVPVTRIYVRSTASVEARGSQNGVVHNRSAGAAQANVTLQSEIVPLPVELIAFNARKDGNGVRMTWATASEQDNAYFEVQMTEDMKSAFKTVGKVKSKVGTSSIRQDYEFTHKGNFTGTRYYRLKQVDFNGTFDYSRVVAVTSSGADLTVGPKVYPNPITSDSKLAYNAETEGKLNVRVVNMNGTTVHNQAYDVEAGENTILLNLNNNLPTGIYILMTEFNGKMQQVKLLKQ